VADQRSAPERNDRDIEVRLDSDAEHEITTHRIDAQRAVELAFDVDCATDWTPAMARDSTRMRPGCA
jgi:hypothetical protein